jgi:hypothetical protein
VSPTQAIIEEVEELDQRWRNGLMGLSDIAKAPVSLPIARARPNSAPSCPRFPPCEAFERRPPRLAPPSAKGRRPKPSYEGRQVKRQVLVSVNSDYQTGCAPCQPRIRRDPAIPNHDPCIREKEFLAAGPIFTSAP